MPKQVYYATRPNIKRLYIRRRHLGLTVLDRLALNKIKDKALLLFTVIAILKRRVHVNSLVQSSLRVLGVWILYQYYKLLSPPKELNLPLPKIISLMRNIDSFEDEDIPPNFRFRNKEQLKRLMQCFQMPEFLRGQYGHKFRMEELLL